jgi:hypothetical protein
MEKPASPQITSFVIRFVHSDSPPELNPGYRGYITHVQSDKELVFNHWEDAVAFIQSFVPAILSGEPELPAEDQKT